MDCLLQTDRCNPIKIILQGDNVIIGTKKYPILKQFNIAPDHASFDYNDSSWFVENLDCRYYTSVNSVRLGLNPKKLKYGDILELGDDSLSDGFVCQLFPEEREYFHTNLEKPKYVRNFQSEKVGMEQHKSKGKKARRKPKKNNYVSKRVKSTVSFKCNSSLSESTTIKQILKQPSERLDNEQIKNSRNKHQLGLQDFDDHDVHSDSSVVSEDRVIIPSKYKLKVDNFSGQSESMEKRKQAENSSILDNNVKDYISSDRSASTVKIKPSNYHIHKKKVEPKINTVIILKRKHETETLDSRKRKVKKNSLGICDKPKQRTSKQARNKMSSDFIPKNGNQNGHVSEKYVSVTEHKGNFPVEFNSGILNNSQVLKKCDYDIFSESKTKQSIDSQFPLKSKINKNTPKVSTSKRAKLKSAVHTLETSDNITSLRTCENTNDKMLFKKSLTNTAPVMKNGDRIKNVRAKNNYEICSSSKHITTHVNEQVKKIDPCTRNYNSLDNSSILSSVTTSKCSQPNEKDIVKIPPELIPDFANDNYESDNPNTSAKSLELYGDNSKSSMTIKCSQANMEKNVIETPSKDALKAILANAGIKLTLDSSDFSSKPFEKNGSNSEALSANTSEDLSNKESEICYVSLIKKIVEMNTVWLEEQEVCKDPPPYITEGVTELPLAFESYNSYEIQFLRMIILEIWECICFHSKPILQNNMLNKFHFSVLECYYTYEFLILKCLTVVSEKTSFVPRAESVIILHLKQKDGSSKDIFGFITTVEQCNNITKPLNSLERNNLPSNWLMTENYWKFEVYVKYRELKIEQDEVLRGTDICNIKTEVKQFKALSNLKHSVLLNDILTPSWKTFPLHSAASPSANTHVIIQDKIIQSVYCEMIHPDPKIILLNGPPGSGKTNAVISIIKRIILSDQLNMRILITSPSSVALDELGRYLIEIKELKASSLTFTRLGKKRHISSRMLPYALKSNFQEYENKFSKFKSDLEYVQTKINELRNKRNKHKELEELSNHERELRRSLDNKLDYVSYMTQILNDAQIVLSVLDDCDELFKCKVNFSCCIVEDAHQANELQTLLPVTLGINKFIIVGDHMQCPANVKSNIAATCGFRRSLLERFQLYFFEMYQKCPSVTFSEPVCMHPQIADYPYRHFYSKLIDISPRTEPRFNSPLNPYIVFNRSLDNHCAVGEFPLNAQQSTADNVGISSAITMCSYILKMWETTTIGIILPSEKEVDIYNKSVFKKLSPSKIEINTVDKFQGRVKPVIILSCFHQDSSRPVSIFSCEHTLNVALTRATHCLIIHGYLHSLKKVPWWNELIYDANLRHRYVTYSPEEEFEKVFKNHILKK